MGWTTLLDENDNEIGYVGDKIWDAAGTLCDNLLMRKLYTEDDIIRMVLEGCQNVDCEPEVKKFLLESSLIYTKAIGRAPNLIELESAIEFVYFGCFDEVINNG